MPQFGSSSHSMLAEPTMCGVVCGASQGSLEEAGRKTVWSDLMLLPFLGRHNNAHCEQREGWVTYDCHMGIV